MASHTVIPGAQATPQMVSRGDEVRGITGTKWGAHAKYLPLPVSCSGFDALQHSLAVRSWGGDFRHGSRSNVSGVTSQPWREARGSTGRLRRAGTGRRQFNLGGLSVLHPPSLSNG